MWENQGGWDGVGNGDGQEILKIPENLVRKKRDKESREQPSLNVFREKGSWKRGSKGKNGLDWEKFQTHKIPGIKLCLFHWN